MPKECQHIKDKVIQTNHGYFCLECGKLTSKTAPKAAANKRATQKKAVRISPSEPAAKPSSTLLTHHKTAVLKPTKKLKINDLSV